jgi:hypothetical protein
MKLSNPNQVNNNSLEFDITIQTQDSDFFLTSYQCSFSFNLNLSELDTISLSYLEESSELANYPINILGHDTIDGLNELLFVSGIGNDEISVNPKIVGTFLIQSSREFSLEDLNLKWNFVGTANTILTGENFSDITDPENHLNFDESVTDVFTEETIPEDFYLSQNYPNPFNPSTKIDFILPEEIKVKLTVFNILGEKVMKVLDQKLASGNHTVEIDGSHLASGTYFYALEAGNYTSIMKMILLK